MDQAPYHPRSSPADAVRLRIRATEMLIGVGTFAAVMHIAVVILLGIVLWPAVDQTWVIAWSVALSSFILFQGSLILRKGGKHLGVAEASRVQRQFEAAALAVGLSWGFAGVALFPESEPGRVFFLVFVMGGMAMSAVSQQHVSVRACLLSICPGIPPLAFRYMFSDLPFNWASGVLLLVYTAVLVNMALRLHRFSHRAFALQLEQERLLDRLEKQTQALDAARAEAEEANSAKSRFLAQASHDLRQPLHAISLFVESLPDAETQAEHEHIMTRVRQSLDVLTKLFDSLLDVTLLDTGGIEVRRTVFRPSDIIAEVEHDFSLVAEACHVRLRIVPSSLAVESDPVLVRRMLQNLISNAIRHSEGGRVLIGCRRRDGNLSIEVADTGSGIDERDQEQIFNEFTRLDSTRMGTSATPGLGLGLSIVKRIAGELGLQVRLSSRPDKGSVFALDGFEVADAKRVQARMPPRAVTGVANGASVFVLDDDPETLAATAILLKRWGCTVETSQEWRDLIDADPDVVICDYELTPEKTGLDVLKELDGTAPAIMISGHTSTDLRREAISMGIPLLHKPIRPAQLRSALLNALAASDKAAGGSEGGGGGSA